MSWHYPLPKIHTIRSASLIWSWLRLKKIGDELSFPLLKFSHSLFCLSNGVTTNRRTKFYGPLEAILVIFGRRVSIFWFESSWKNMKNDTTCVRMRSGITLETQKHRKKARRSVEFSSFISCDKQTVFAERKKKVRSAKGCLPSDRSAKGFICVKLFFKEGFILLSPLCGKTSNFSKSSL